MPLPKTTALDAQGMPLGQPLRAGLEISPREAKRRMQDGSLLLVDCRTVEEWDLVRVPGSQLVPLHEIEQRVEDIQPAPGQQVAMLCHHGVRSMKAALALRQMGLQNVVSVAGGIDLWALAVCDDGLPQYDREGMKLLP
jgi:adenylyltransferase/sulfurtransferase